VQHPSPSPQHCSTRHSRTTSGHPCTLRTSLVLPMACAAGAANCRPKAPSTLATRPRAKQSFHSRRMSAAGLTRQVGVRRLLRAALPDEVVTTPTNNNRVSRKYQYATLHVMLWSMCIKVRRTNTVRPCSEPTAKSHCPRGGATCAAVLPHHEPTRACCFLCPSFWHDARHAPPAPSLRSL
jgi:hypothetical protein